MVAAFMEMTLIRYGCRQIAQDIGTVAKGHAEETLNPLKRQGDRSRVEK